jgi:CheY-like chemotaxis protein
MLNRFVLVIDDDDDIRAITRLSLEAVGKCDVRTEASGEAGIAAALEEPPDAILLDVMMPGMDGPATFERLQAMAETRSIPVVLLTAKVAGVDDQRFDGLGVKGVIAKPFDAMSLPVELARIVGWDA